MTDEDEEKGHLYIIIKRNKNEKRKQLTGRQLSLILFYVEK